MTSPPPIRSPVEVRAPAVAAAFALVCPSLTLKEQSIVAPPFDSIGTVRVTALKGGNVSSRSYLNIINLLLDLVHTPATARKLTKGTTMTS